MPKPLPFPSSLFPGVSPISSPGNRNQKPKTNYSEPETPPKNQREIEREMSAKNTASGII